MTPREKWYDAYRRMRTVYDSSTPPTDEEIARFSRLTGYHYLAFCRLCDRRRIDPLTITPQANLMAKKLIDEILAEEKV